MKTEERIADDTVGADPLNIPAFLDSTYKLLCCQGFGQWENWYDVFIRHICTHSDLMRCKLFLCTVNRLT